MFWTNFVKLCAESGVAPNVVAAKCGVKSTGTVSGWKKGAIPRESIMLKIADYFGVTVAELLEENKQKNKPTTVTGDELTEAEADFIKLFRSIPEQEREMVTDMIRAALHSKGLL